MKVVIAGAGAVGTHLSKLLSTEHHDCVLIDDDEDRLGGMDSNYDIMAVNASPTSIKTLKDAGVGSADLFVGVTRYESRNITACTLAHAFARIDNYEYLSPQNLPFFHDLGIDSLVYPEVLAATDIINGLKLSWVRQRWDVHDGALVLLGIKLREGCEILNQPLKDLCGPDDPYHIVAIKRSLFHDHQRVYSLYPENCRQGTLRGRAQRHHHGRRKDGCQGSTHHARLHERQDHRD